MAIVVFDDAGFRSRYPEFNALSDTTLGAFFVEACIYCNNTNESIITDATIRGVILNALVAHIAAIDAAPLVGRVTSASEGSVSASVDMGPTSGSNAWYNQTKYGASAWRMMSPYRCAIWIPGLTYPNTYVPGR